MCLVGLKVRVEPWDGVSELLVQWKITNSLVPLVSESCAAVKDDTDRLNDQLTGLMLFRDHISNSFPTDE